GLGDPAQRREPEVVTSVHQPLSGLTQICGVRSIADFIRDDLASIAAGCEVPRVIEGWLGAGGVAVPANSSKRDELADLAFQRQAECRPPEGGTVPEHRASVADDAYVLGVRIPLWPLGRLDDVLPYPLARGVDEELVVREEIGLQRIELRRPMDVG